MTQYFFRRLIQAIPVIFGVIIITFILMYIIPGDPVISMVGERYSEETIDHLRKEMNLDKPLPMQFINYVLNILQGDLGNSFITGEPVSTMIMEKFPNTMTLAGSPGSFLDKSIMILALAGISAPVFWVGLILVLVVGVILQWLPPTGYGGIEYIILPAIALGSRSSAYLARLTRATMLEELNKDYIRTARSKGLSKWSIYYKHAFPNTLIPVITVIGTDFGSYLSGAVLTESIFGWPGIGRLALDAIMKRDFPVIQGTILLMALMFVLMNVIIDILYGVVDPRIRMERSSSSE